LRSRRESLFWKARSIDTFLSLHRFFINVISIFWLYFKHFWSFQIFYIRFIKFSLFFLNWKEYKFKEKRGLDSCYYISPTLISSLFLSTNYELIIFNIYSKLTCSSGDIQRIPMGCLDWVAKFSWRLWCDRWSGIAFSCSHIERLATEDCPWTESSKRRKQELPSRHVVIALYPKMAKCKVINLKSKKGPSLLMFVHANNDQLQLQGGLNHLVKCWVIKLSNDCFWK
jgi:hypothetical protein